MFGWGKWHLRVYRSQNCNVRKDVEDGRQAQPRIRTPHSRVSPPLSNGHHSLSTSQRAIEGPEQGHVCKKPLDQAVPQLTVLSPAALGPPQSQVCGGETHSTVSPSRLWDGIVGSGGYVYAQLFRWRSRDLRALGAHICAPSPATGQPESNPSSLKSSLFLFIICTASSVSVLISDHQATFSAPTLPCLSVCSFGSLQPVHLSIHIHPCSCFCSHDWLQKVCWFPLLSNSWESICLFSEPPFQPAPCLTVSEFCPVYASLVRFPRG